MQFTNYEDINEYIDFLELKGRPVSQELYNERDRLKALASVDKSEYIFGTMAANNPFMNPQKEKVVRDMVNHLMEDGENATQPCLLMGKVQCGKTDTFESIIALAFDKGFDVAVVLTKGTNTLTSQTINRLKADFKHFEYNGRTDQYNIVRVYDILDDLKARNISRTELVDHKQKTIIVCKKEATNLTRLKELFRNDPLLCQQRVLFCDDEADFASRAYLKKQNKLDLLELGKIIDETLAIILRAGGYYRFLQVTATPYSLFLQPDGTVKLRDDKEATCWLPRYTGLVPIHDKYVGGKHYFELSQNEDSMFSYLPCIINEDILEIARYGDEFVQGHGIHSQRLGDLSIAVVTYIFSTAVRMIQMAAEGKDYRSSCLIHSELKKESHQVQKEIVQQIISELKDAVIDDGNQDAYIQYLEESAYNSLWESHNLGVKEGLISTEWPTYCEVINKVREMLSRSDYKINIVNSDVAVSSMLNQKGQLRLEQSLNFFIGGGILDRGITIDNMLCFFYGRKPGRFQMDTVLQHARMYGARSMDDMAVTRFYTTEKIFDVLRSINEIDSALYNYIEKHADRVQTEDFLNVVFGYDKRINPSAANKYTPANTRVLKPGQRILPVGFQTGEAHEIAETIAKIDDMMESFGANDTDIVTITYQQVLDLITLINETYRYGEEFENVDYRWDPTEMISALDFVTFETDGLVNLMLKTDRNLSRERKLSKPTRGRWQDAPATGDELKKARIVSDNRPTLILIRENGLEENGWRNTPFYWPTLLLPNEMNCAIFTINSERKFKEPKPQIKLQTIDNYPPEEILHITIKKLDLFNLMLGYSKIDPREIKNTTASLYIAKDFFGNKQLAEGVDPDKRYRYCSYNNGVFPWEIKPFKYIHYRTSNDLSGSQLLVELDKSVPFELLADQDLNDDYIYSSKRGEDGEYAASDDFCTWFISFNINQILESYLLPEDADEMHKYEAMCQESVNEDEYEEEEENESYD
jgi:hypothetical protein